MQGPRDLVKDVFARIAARTVRHSLRLVAQELHQFDKIGRTEFHKKNTALDFLRNVADRRSDNRELTLVETALVDVSKAASDLRRFPKRLVEVLEVENAGSFVGNDEVQSRARIPSARLGCLAVTMHPLRQAPCPKRRGYGGGQVPAHFAQHSCGTLLFGAAQISKRPPRLEDLPEHL